MAKIKSKHWVPFNKKGFWTKFLTLVVASTLWLSGMAILSAGVLERLADPSRFANKNILLVHVFPETTAEKTKAKTQLVLETLRGMPGVVNATALPKKDLEQLIEPILGTGQMSLLPIPIIIKATTNKIFTLDLQEVHAQLLEKTTGIVVETEVTLVKKMTAAISIAQGMSWTIPLASILVMTGIIALTIAGIVFAHRTTIEILYNLGTYRRTIVMTFTRHVVKYAFIGTLIGSILSIGTMVLLAAIMQIIPLIIPSHAVMLLLLLFPIAMVGLTWVVAHGMIRYILAIVFKRT